MCNFKVMSKEDKEWKGRCDAKTLAEAEIIKADKDRYANAVKQADVLVQKQLEETKKLAKVANTKISTRPYLPTRHSNSATIGQI